jgi:NitT/TauT family transport system ATP-binding protein
MPELMELRHIRHCFAKPDGRSLKVLEDISLDLREGEIVGILGKSGSGKSTLLRVIAGLITPTEGEVIRRESEAQGGIAMVFQSFALFPWLTVLENVELGLEARQVPAREARARALSAIDLIGLDGYESAYPRELSGGMKQRVGFARALVVNPELLLMDEAFSALDVLTAETLKTDFLELWHERRIPLKSVVLVTHNIEEAVLMSDRILVFAANPGRIVTEIPVDLPTPRDRQSPEFRAMVESIYTLMTSGMQRQAYEYTVKSHEAGIGMFEKLPRVSPNHLAGAVEALIAPPYEGHADLPELPQALALSTEEVLQIVEVLRLLKFADVEAGDINLTVLGKAFGEADTQLRKQIFAEQLMHNIPLAAYIYRILQERPNNHAPRVRFLTRLEDHMTEEEAITALGAVTSWGRYAELFAYNDNTETYSLENPTA